MQLLKFLLVGIINTTIGLSVIYVAMYLVGMDYVSANLTGYAVGIVIAFVLNRSWTFQHKGPWQYGLARWLIVVSIAYTLNLITIIGLHKGLGVETYVVQLAGIVVYTVTTFLGARYFAFSNAAGVQEQRS